MPTRKNHFHILFIDKMLERLAEHAYYYFLVGYSRYNEIKLAPDDQEKIKLTRVSNASLVYICGREYKNLTVNKSPFKNLTDLKNIYFKNYLHSGKREYKNIFF